MDRDRGFGAGVRSSKGDPRIVLLLNLVLSLLFGYAIVWGFSFVGIAEYTTVNALTAAIILFGLGYLFSR
ncbi:MAG: hypothetical protein ACQETB_13310 [Halobacteriota archaeon]